MMNTPYPNRDELFARLPVSPAGCDIESYPIIHQAAVDATYVACNPARKDAVLAAYAELGWQVDNVTDDDYRNMQARRVEALLLDAWSAAEGSGSKALTDRVRSLYYEVEGGRF
jgi:hypothetical protein